MFAFLAKTIVEKMIIDHWHEESVDFALSGGFWGNCFLKADLLHLRISDFLHRLDKSLTIKNLRKPGLGAFRAEAYRRCSIACSRVQLLHSAGSRVQLSWVQLSLSAGSGVHFL